MYQKCIIGEWCIISRWMTVSYLTFVSYSISCGYELSVMHSLWFRVYDSFVLPKSFILFLSFTFASLNNEVRTIKKAQHLSVLGRHFETRSKKGQRNNPSFKIASKAERAVLSTEPMTDGSESLLYHYIMIANGCWHEGSALQSNQFAVADQVYICTRIPSRSV